MPAARVSGVFAVVILCAWEAVGDSKSAGEGRGMGSPQVAKGEVEGASLRVRGGLRAPVGVSAVRYLVGISTARCHQRRHGETAWRSHPPASPLRALTARTQHPSPQINEYLISSGRYG